MYTDIIKGNWHQVKGKIMQKWSKITNDHLLLMKGNSEELRGVLEKSYGYSKDKADKEIKEFIEENKWK
jgi:uncharacterized protein YjbJ (UPF0337 family)